MNIYFLTRWENGDDEEGPDSSLEASLIVRADTSERVSDIADPSLARDKALDL